MIIVRGSAEFVGHGNLPGIGPIDSHSEDSIVRNDRIPIHAIRA